MVGKTETPIKKLSRIGSIPLSCEPAGLAALETLQFNAGAVAQVLSLLESKNGYVAFEAALHVFSTDDAANVPGLVTWNSPDGWRKLYGLENDPILFFAQDLFANQFGITSDKVFRLEAEWGQLTEHSLNLANWAETVLQDYDYETGWSVGREWQLANHAIDASERLLAKKPIVLGGDYVSENFAAIPTAQCMQQLGRLFNEIKDKPDGTPVRVKNWLRK